MAVDLPKHKLLRGDFRVRSLGGDPRTMGGARVTVREGNELRVQRQGLVRGVPCSAAEVHGE